MHLLSMRLTGSTAPDKISSVMNDLAVITLAGRQYLVRKGKTVQVNAQLPDKKSLVLPDQLAGRKVTVKVVKRGRSPKLTVLKFKPKARYLRRAGHRQDLTFVTVEKIED